ncbi:hypothetical protein Tco_0993387 [Tanacetum coccineum]|uniref:Uncharacterized protein n=1 Tax=Tanacetum coccineum TaxID=301880 RepID=A0ABQ5F4S1_9ASTR
MGLWYPNDSGFELIAYSDANHAGCKDDCKSTSGGVQFLGRKLVSWSSKKQDCTEMSTIEAEYVSLSACCAQSTADWYTQGTHRTPSAPRSPNPATETAESSVPKRSIVIRFRLSSRQSARLTPPVLVPLAEKANEMIFQDMIQSPRSDKESPEVEIVQEKEEETTKDTEVEPDKDTPMRRRISPIPSPTRSPRNLSTLVSSDAEKLQELTVTYLIHHQGSSEPKERFTCHGHKVIYLFVNLLMFTPDGNATLRGERESYTQQVKKEDFIRKFEIMFLCILRYPQTACTSFDVTHKRSGRSHDDANPEEEIVMKKVETSSSECGIWYLESRVWDKLMWRIPTSLYFRDSMTIDEAKLKKMADEMLRQRCTSGDEHQYHIDQMKNFLQTRTWNDIYSSNSKKEKRVMRHSEIHKFCDATMRRMLKGLKSYYNDVKYGYVQKELTNDEVEFLKLFEEEIEVRLNYRDQMRRWEMYVICEGPLGPRWIRLE